MPCVIQMAHGADEKTVVVTLRMSPKQLRLIQERAKKRGVKLRQWMRSILLQVAERQSSERYVRIKEPDGITS